MLDHILLMITENMLSYIDRCNLFMERAHTPFDIAEKPQRKHLLIVFILV